MTSKLIPLTKFTTARGVLTKTITRQHGVFTNTPPRMYAGTAQTEWVRLADLPTFFEELDAKECITLGIYDETDETVEVMTVSEYQRRGFTGRIHQDATGKYSTRASESLVQPKNTLLFLDYDHDENSGRNIESPEEFIRLLSNAAPELDLANTTYVRTYSTSGGLYEKSSGKCLKKADGFHIYFEVSDGEDIKRFAKELEKRCWLAGLGHIKMARDGRTHPRVIFDTAVFQPERLCFEAGAFIPYGQDFYQSRPKADFVKKEEAVLNTHKLRNLTELENNEVKELIHEAQSSDVMRQLKKEKLEQLAQVELANLNKLGINLSMREAKSRAELKMEKSILHPDDILKFEDGREVSVQMAVMYAHEFDGCNVKDPLRPDKDYSKAKFYANLDNAQVPHPQIHSFVGGDITFNLEEAVAYYEQKDKLGNSTLVDLVNLPIIHDQKYLPKIELEHGLTVIKSAKGTGKTFTLANSLKALNLDKARTCLISHLVSLTGSSCKKFGLEDYNEIQLQEGRSLKIAPRLGICFNSIYKLRGNRYEVVIIDEVVPFIRNIKSGTVKYPASCIDVLREIIVSAKYVILMDADLSMEIMEFILNPVYGLIDRDIRTNVIENIYKPPAVENRKVTFYQKEDNKPDLPAFLAKLLDTTIEQGKGTFYASNSKADVIRKASALISKLGGNAVLNEEHFMTEVAGRRVITITSANSQLKETQDFIVNLNEQIRPTDILLSSPSMGTGHSIDMVDAKPLFDTVFACFSSQGGNLPSDCIQHLSRVRGCDDIHVVYQQTKMSLVEDPKIIANYDITGKQKIFDRGSSLSATGGMVWNKTVNAFIYQDHGFANWHCNITAYENKIRNKFGMHLAVQIEDEGYTIEHHYKPDINGDGLHSLKDIKETAALMRELEREKLIETPLITDESYEVLNNAIYTTPDEKRELFKKRNANYFGFLENDELLNHVITSSATRLSGLRTGMLLGANPKHLFMLDQNNRLDNLVPDNKRTAHNAHYWLIRKNLEFFGVNVVNGQLIYDGRHISREKKIMFAENMSERNEDLRILHRMKVNTQTEDSSILFTSQFLASVGLQLKRGKATIMGKRVNVSYISDESLDILNTLLRQAAEHSTSMLYSPLSHLCTSLDTYNLVRALPNAKDYPEFVYIRSFAPSTIEMVDSYLDKLEPDKMVA